MNNLPANERLLQWLGRTRQTQYELAESIGVSQGYVSGIITGRHKPSLDIAAKIERVAGIPASAWATASEAAAS